MSLPLKARMRLLLFLSLLLFFMKALSCAKTAKFHLTKLASKPS